MLNRLSHRGAPESQHLLSTMWMSCFSNSVLSCRCFLSTRFILPLVVLLFHLMDNGSEPTFAIVPGRFTLWLLSTAQWDLGMWGWLGGNVLYCSGWFLIFTHIFIPS